MFVFNTSHAVFYSAPFGLAVKQSANLYKDGKLPCGGVVGYISDLNGIQCKVVYQTCKSRLLYQISTERCILLLSHNNAMHFT